MSVVAIGLGGDYPEFVGEFLEGFLEDIADSGRPLIPELSDMPRGWEAPIADPTDVTESIRPEGDQEKEV